MPDNNVQIGEWWTIRDYSIGDPPEDPQFYFRIENIVEDDITLMNPLSGLVIVSGFNFYDIYCICWMETVYKKINMLEF